MHNDQGKSRKFVLKISGPLLDILESIESDALSHDPKFKITDYLVLCIESHHTDTTEYPEQVNMKELSELIRNEATGLAGEAKLEETRNRNDSMSKYLRAASLELEALSFVAPDDEKQLISALIVALSYIKQGLGFKNLPTV